MNDKTRLKRIDFVLLYDVTDANPNGDPDAGNMPRIDVDSNLGIVTDVCLKRKIRNYIDILRTCKGEDFNFSQRYESSEKKCEIFVKEKAILNKQQERAADALTDLRKEVNQENKKAWMCANFYDIRTFGAVMSTGTDKGKGGEGGESDESAGNEEDKGRGKGKKKGKDTKPLANCGQVRGPVQISFSRSVDPIHSQEYSITRCAVTKEADEGDTHQKERTMGYKYAVPYALYMAKGSINPFFAAQTGFDEADLELLKKALVHMFDFDASAARPAGSMVMRRVLFFVHDSELGSAPAHKLYECVKVSKKEGVDVPRSYTDYDVQIAPLPAGVKLEDITEQV